MGEQCDTRGVACADGSGCTDACTCLRSTCFAATAAGDARSAAEACRLAAESASNDPAVLLAAVGTTALVAVLDAPGIADLAGRAGFAVSGSAAAVCGLTVAAPEWASASTPRSGEGLTVFRDVGLPAVDQARALLTSYPGGATTRIEPAQLPPCARADGMPSIEVDDGDILAVLAFTRGVQAAVRLQAAYDLDVPLEPVVAGATTIAALFSGSPGLFLQRPGAVGELAASREALEAALDAFAAAVASIDGETDEQSDDLLVIDPADRAAVLDIREGAVRLRAALSGDGVFEADRFDVLPTSQRLRLAAAFDGAIASLRPWVPPFDAAGVPDPCAIPDYGFGGIAPDMTASTFRKLTGATCR